jgi:hypothetical protein
MSEETNDMARGSHQKARAGAGGVTSLEHTVEDDLILSSPVSEQRKTAFLSDFLAQRREAQAVEMLFERAGAFKLKQPPPPKDVESAGFRSIVFKGPFVEGSNWLTGSAWGYATAMERHLLRRLEEALREATIERIEASVERDARAIPRALSEMARELVGSGFQPSLFAFAGELGSQLYTDLTKEVIPDWDPRVQATLRTTYRIVGMFAGVPIMDIPVSPMPAVYAVDLASFASLTRYGEKPEFEVKEIDEERAREILARQPRLIMDPPPNSGLEEERIRQLQLRVSLDLWETYELTVKDPRAVVGRPLVGPILD